MFVFLKGGDDIQSSYHLFLKCKNSKNNRYGQHILSFFLFLICSIYAHVVTLVGFHPLILPVLKQTYVPLSPF